MPGLDGFQTLDTLHQRYDVLVIMLTVRVEIDSLKKATEQGVNDYVTNLFRITILTARIKAKLRLVRPDIQKTHPITAVISYPDGRDY